MSNLYILFQNFEIISLLRIPNLLFEISVCWIIRSFIRLNTSWIISLLNKCFKLSYYIWHISFWCYFIIWTSYLDFLAHYELYTVHFQHITSLWLIISLIALNISLLRIHSTLFYLIISTLSPYFNIFYYLDFIPPCFVLYLYFDILSHYFWHAISLFWLIISLFGLPI